MVIEESQLGCCMGALSSSFWTSGKGMKGVIYNNVKKWMAEINYILFTNPQSRVSELSFDDDFQQYETLVVILVM